MTTQNSKTLESLEYRIHRLENFTNCTCYRCSKSIPFNQAEFIPQPSFPRRELILCYGCYSVYREILYKNEGETVDILISYLNEKRR